MKYTIPIFFICGFLVISCGCTQKTASLQKSVVPPDQTLYETGTKFLDKGQYLRARMALQTMINTYPDSEMTADAYYAIGDTFYEEGGTASLLQAEQQYKDFIVFFPAHPKAQDAQLKIIALNMKMMGSPDRDQDKTLVAEHEIKKFLEMSPDSDYVPIVKQYLVLVEDQLAQEDLSVGNFYAGRGNPYAAVRRWQTVLEKYPNFYKTPEVLYKLAETMEKINPGEAEKYLDTLVEAFPSSEYVESAKQKLTAMGKPVPSVDVELAASKEAGMRNPEGFSPLKPLVDFGKALGFVAPPDRYEEAKKIREAEKAKTAKAEQEKPAAEGEKTDGILIQDEIRKPVSDEKSSPQK
jgi:outer membrane assembly lipoprotein YfiO